LGAQTFSTVSIGFVEAIQALTGAKITSILQREESNTIQTEPLLRAIDSGGACTSRALD
jgi:hypothetical protein